MRCLAGGLLRLRWNSGEEHKVVTPEKRRCPSPGVQPNYSASLFWKIQKLESNSIIQWQGYETIWDEQMHRLSRTWPRLLHTRIDLTDQKDFYLLEGMAWAGQLSTLEAEKLTVLNIQTFDNYCNVKIILLSGSEKWTDTISNRCTSELFLGCHDNPHEPLSLSNRKSQPCEQGGRRVGMCPARCEVASKSWRTSVPVAVGWGRISFMAIDGSPALPKYLQGRPFDAASVLALRLRWIPRVHWIAFTKGRAAHCFANYGRLPIAAACFSAAGSAHVGFTRLSMRRTGRCNHRQ